MDPDFELSGSSSPSQLHPPLDTLCTNGCGLAGSPNTRGLCSHCYQNTAKIEPRKSPIKVSLEKEIAAASTRLTAGADDPPAAKSRCNMCRRKFGLLGFPCRCGGGFCNAHRHPEAHACKFDYRQAGKRAIEDQNPLVRADKMPRRI